MGTPATIRIFFPESALGHPVHGTVARVVLGHGNDSVTGMWVSLGPIPEKTRGAFASARAAAAEAPQAAPPEPPPIADERRVTRLFRRRRKRAS